MTLREGTAAAGNGQRQIGVNCRSVGSQRRRAGVIEIIAGLGVWFKPKFFAYVVSAWLLLIIVNLLLIPGYFDVALRDFGLALGALALGRLSQEYSR